MQCRVVRRDLRYELVPVGLQDASVALVHLLQWALQVVLELEVELAVETVIVIGAACDPAAEDLAHHPKRRIVHDNVE